jgi:hypothetical protein
MRPTSCLCLCEKIALRGVTPITAASPHQTRQETPRPAIMYPDQYHALTLNNTSPTTPYHAFDSPLSLQFARHILGRLAFLEPDHALHARVSLAPANLRVCLFCTSCTHVATSSPSFVNILCLVSFCLLHSLPLVASLPLQYQSSAIPSPWTFHLREHPLICTEVARRVEVDGMIQTDLLHPLVSSPVIKLLPYSPSCPLLVVSVPRC